MTDFPDVRRAQRADQDRIGTLWRAFLREQEALDDRLTVAEDALERWHNDFPMWLDDETRRIYVATSDGSIQGFATAHRTGPPPIYAPAHEVYLDELFVVPEVRRQGLGRQLVRAVRHWAEQLPATRIRLQTMSANETAQAFWEALGARTFSMALTLELEAESESTPQRRRIGF